MSEADQEDKFIDIFIGKGNKKSVIPLISVRRVIKEIDCLNRVVCYVYDIFDNCYFIAEKDYEIVLAQTKKSLTVESLQKSLELLKLLNDIKKETTIFICK